MIRWIVGAALAGVMCLSGCGPDEELVASGVSHRCNMEKALKAAQTAKTPDEKATQAKEADKYRKLLEAVYNSGDAEKTRAAVAERKCP